MQARHGLEFLKFAALAAGFIAGASLANAQQSTTTAQQTTPAPSIPLQTYKAADTSASVGVPAGWKVTKAEYGIIQMSGPNGEAISLGLGFASARRPGLPGRLGRQDRQMSGGPSRQLRCPARYAR